MAHAADDVIRRRGQADSGADRSFQPRDNSLFLSGADRFKKVRKGAKYLFGRQRGDSFKQKLYPAFQVFSFSAPFAVLFQQRRKKQLLFFQNSSIRSRDGAPVHLLQNRIGQDARKAAGREDTA